MEDSSMSRKCSLSNQKGLSGNRVSHSKRRTRHKQEVNLQHKWMVDEQTGRKVRVKLSTSMLRTIRKNGFSKTVKKLGLK